MQAEYAAMFAEALKAGGERDYQRSAELLGRITSETDGVPKAYLYLGRSYHALGRYDLAIPPLKYFIELRPASSAGHLFLGRAYLALGAPALAVRSLKRALALKPGSATALALIGLAYLKARRPEIAADYLGRAVALAPGNAKLYTGYLNTLLVQAIRVFRRGELDLSRQMLEFIQGKRGDGILVDLHLAVIYREQGKLREALERYDSAILQAPQDPSIRFQRATVLHLLGERAAAAEELRGLNILSKPEQFSWDPESTNRVSATQYFRKAQYREAIRSAEQVLHASPKDVDMHLLVGEAHRILKNFERASNHFARVLDVKPRLLEPRYGLAMIHWENERWSEMRRELARIERIDPGNDVSSYYACLCACKLKEPSEKTIPALQAEIRKSGPDPFLFSALGEEYIRGGAAGLAEKWFKKAIVLAEDHRPAYLGLIAVSALSGDKGEASSAYEAYLARFPDDFDVRKDFIRFLVDAKEYAKAVSQVEKYVPYRKKDGKLLRLLALCYRKSGRLRQAATLYRRLLREEPSNEELLRSLIYCMEKVGNRENALVLLEKAVAYLDEKTSPTLLLMLGVLYYKSDSMEKAMSAFRKVTETSVDDWRAYLNIGMIYKRQGAAPFADKYFAKAEALKQKAGRR